MKNNIELKNQKILVIGGMLLILFSCLSHYINRFCFENKLRKIEELFTSESFITIDNNKFGPDYNLTYGELTWEGMENISKYMELKNWNKNTFIDLGSGNGRTLAYAILHGFKEAKGTEIVQERHEYAMKMREKLDEYMRDKIKLSKTDLFKLDPSYFPPGSVVFISNLVFPEKTNQKLINFLSEIAPDGTIIILSALPNNINNFKVIEKIDAPMSWSKTSQCYVLRKVKNKL